MTFDQIAGLLGRIVDQYQRNYVVMPRSSFWLLIGFLVAAILLFGFIDFRTVIGWIVDTTRFALVSLVKVWKDVKKAVKG